jgi:tetratricopeptide (TPR) repeat protein
LRISYHYEIEPLSKDGTEYYIRFRLLAAGTRKNIFSKRSMTKIFSFSKGNPRLINMICDRALLTAFANSTRRVTSNIAAECAEELRLPGESRAALAASVNADPSLTKLNNALSTIQLWKKNIYRLSKQFREVLINRSFHNLSKKNFLIGISITVLSLLFLIFHSSSNFPIPQENKKPNKNHETIKSEAKNSPPSIPSSPDVSNLRKGADKQTFNNGQKTKIQNTAIQSFTKKKSSPYNVEVPKNSIETVQKILKLSKKEQSGKSKSEATNIAATPDRGTNPSAKTNYAPSSRQRKTNPTSVTSEPSLEFIEKIITAGYYYGAADLLEKRVSNWKEVDPQSKLYSLYIKALYGKSRQLLERGETEEANKLILKVITFDPENWQAFFDLGKIYTRKKKYAKSIKMYKKTIELNPSYPDAYYNLGFIYSLINDYKKAERKFIQSAELKPDYLDKIYFNLSMVQYKQGKTRKTIKNLNKALRINPENRRAKIMLKRIETIN